MLRTRLILPLAFASVAFLWGCQEQASSPVGPEGPGPLFHLAHAECEAHKKNDTGCDGGTVDATWNASTADGTTSDVRVLEGNLVGPNGSKNTLQTAFNEPVKINLTNFLGKVDQVGGVDVGNNCFGTADIDAIMMVGQVTPSDIDNAIIRFFFDAKGTDEPASDVNYVLTVFATFELDRPWPPEDLQPNTITGGTFVLAHNNGPGKKVACTGEDDLDDFSVTITEKAT